MYKKTA